MHPYQTPLLTNPMFKRFFLCLDAMRNDFVRGCRSFKGMDGCYLKGPYGAVILVAIYMDVNNGIFLVAFTIVKMENMDNWTFFFFFPLVIRFHGWCCNTW